MSMIPHLARKLAAAVRGMDATDPSAPEVLSAAGVPVSDADCRTCADPCDEGHEEYSRKFDVDLESEMRGTVKPYHRQVLISTGKADWQHDIASDSASLAHHLSSLQPPKPPKGPKQSSSTEPTKEKRRSNSQLQNGNGNGTKASGVYAYASTTRLSVLNGSHTSRADDPDTHDSVIVLPDYVAVVNVPRSFNGAEVLYRHALDPAIERAGTTAHGEELEREDPLLWELRTYTLPYSCLIMLCSHKKRDARCHIAAIRLEADFQSQLEARGWTVDLDLPDLSSHNAPLETTPGASTTEERAEAAKSQLRALSAPPGSEGATPGKSALILKNSHIGGHKFAGNVIIYFPSGASIWYGRVTPHEVPAVIEQTLINGKILAPLLRGGLGISRPGCSSVIDW